MTSLPAEDKLTIAVTLAGRPRFLDRPKGEPLERTLARMQMTAAKGGAGPCTYLRACHTTKSNPSPVSPERWVLAVLPAFYVSLERVFSPSTVR